MKSAAAILGAALLAGCATAPAPAVAPAASPTPPRFTPTARQLTPPRNVELAAELAAMAAEDQEVRRRWLKDQKSEAIREEMRQLSVKHVARLDQIVAEHGWPGISLVGFNGMGDAWTIAQHGGREFLEKMLPLMYEAVRKLDLDESLYGTSLDRVLIRQGRKQVYGTQFMTDPDTGKCEPQPIEDPEHVEERRRRAGMTSLAEYTRELCARYMQPQK